MGSKLQNLFNLILYGLINLQTFGIIYIKPLALIEMIPNLKATKITLLWLETFHYAPAAIRLP